MQPLDSLGLYTKRTTTNAHYYHRAMALLERLEALGHRDLTVCLDAEWGRDKRGPFQASVSGDPDLIPYDLGTPRVGATEDEALTELHKVLGDDHRGIGCAELEAARAKAKPDLTRFNRVIAAMVKEEKASKVNHESGDGRWSFRMDAPSIDLARRLVVHRGPESWSVYGEWQSLVPSNITGRGGGWSFAVGALIGETYPGGMVHSCEMTTSSIFTTEQMLDIRVVQTRAVVFANKVAKILTRTPPNSTEWLRRFY